MQLTTPVRKTIVSISLATLAEVWAFACQSGEFESLIGYLSDGKRGRCAWGVLHTILDRMGVPDHTMGTSGRFDPQADERSRIVLGLAELGNRAAARLGFGQAGLQGANDAGMSLEAIGRAIQAEIDSALMRDYV